MTDADLIAKKLAAIETYVRELDELARIDLLRDDLREQRFIEHTLQLAVQAALDAASHIVSNERLGEPRTNRELFDLLARDGWLESDLAESLRNMAGVRNVLVHGYDAVDLGIVEDVVRHNLGDLRAYADAIRRRLNT